MLRCLPLELLPPASNTVWVWASAKRAAPLFNNEQC
jgi:hypothetical protein